MNEKLYNELREIEDRLFHIVLINELLDSEIGDIWSDLFNYLEEINYNS